MNATAREAPPNYAVPFDGPGQLATIWSGRRLAPYGDALIITNRGTSRRVQLEKPGTVRWRTPTELMVQQDSYSQSGVRRYRTLRIDREGNELGPLNLDEDFYNPEPAPGGNLLAFQRSHPSGEIDLAVLDFAAGLRPVTIYPASPRLHMFSGTVWSPDASHLATTTLVDDPQEKGTLYPRLVILDRSDADNVRRIPDGPNGQDAERAGVAPLFWNARGLYVRSNRGLLRCDPNGAGCQLVYSPGEARFAFAGTAVGNDQALLLVQDHRPDPLETRAKEIHQVDLTTGQGRVLLRLPDGVFVDDIDWIADPTA